MVSRASEAQSPTSTLLAVVCRWCERRELLSLLVPFLGSVLDHVLQIASLLVSGGRLLKSNYVK